MAYTNHTLSVQASEDLQPRLLRHRVWRLGAMTALGWALAWGQANAQANDQSGHGNHSAQASAPASSTSAAADSEELSEGEVTRWDARSQKVTLRHGELKNLNMPPMTMVFTLQDLSQASQIKVGDKVLFRAERVNGAFVATQLQVMN